MKKNIIIILLSFLIFGCNSEDDKTQTTIIESSLIAKNDLYGNGDEGIDQQNLIITNTINWNVLLSQMDSVNNITDSFIETEIDFSRFQVIAVFDEIKRNGGHSLELNITENSENILITISDLFPGGDTTNVITQPFHIVKIPITDLPIIFE